MKNVLIFMCGIGFFILCCSLSNASETSQKTSIDGKSQPSSVMKLAAGTCSITCYEKTPECYVTKDEAGCLIISNEKPKRNKQGDLICKIPSCDIKTTIHSHGGKTSTETTTTTEGKTTTHNSNTNTP